MLARLSFCAGKKVALVRGDVSNIKITYPQDLRVAEAMLEA